MFTASKLQLYRKIYLKAVVAVERDVTADNS